MNNLATLIITLECGLLLLGGCAPTHPENTASTAKMVATVSPTTGPAMPPVLVTGILSSADETKLSFKTGGVIRRIHVAEGQAVHANQLLAELLPAELDAAASQAKQLAEKSQRDLARGEALFAEHVIPLEQLENLRTQAAVTNAQLDAARFNQQWTRITAPSAGTVLRKVAEEHEAVGPGQPVLILGGNRQGYIVKAAVADRDLVLLRKGDSVKIDIDALPGLSLLGMISTLGGAASAENGLFPIEVALILPTHQISQQLVTGMVAHLALTPRNQGQELLYVPTDAIVSGKDRQATVYVVEQGKAHKRSVETAFLTRDSVAIASGLKPDEHVATAGALYLNDGDSVQVIAQ